MAGIINDLSRAIEIANQRGDDLEVLELAKKRTAWQRVHERMRDQADIERREGETLAQAFERIHADPIHRAEIEDDIEREEPTELFRRERI